MAVKEEKITIQGPTGQLEAKIAQQADEYERFAVICHPHPLYHGTMDNKVVTTTARQLAKLGIPNVRFNYRGVGASEGEYAATIGETEDCIAVLDWAKQHWSTTNYLLAGFSFGAFIATNTALKTKQSSQLITIAPAVHHSDFQKFSGQIKCPWLVIQPDHDEVVPPQEVYQWYEELQAEKSLVRVADCSHFFHGKLTELQQILLQYLGEQDDDTN